MRVLVACEYSGRVRDAMISRGHDAWSCDLLPTESPGPHLQGDVLGVLHLPWDMMIAFPPCTHLCLAGARYWKERAVEQIAAAAFVIRLAEASIPRIAIENPVGRLNQMWRYPDQYVHPWAFGDPYTKKTCLWLKGLPALMATQVVVPTYSLTEKVCPGSRQRGKRRSLMPLGMARAMAEQWG